MNGGAFAYRKTYVLGRGYSVEFVFDATAGVMDVVWEPDIPPRKIGRKLIPSYKAARTEFLSSLGTPILVVDL